MKKVILILLSIILSGVAIAQYESYEIFPEPIIQNTNHPNSLYAVVQPVDLGYGLRYDHIIKNVGGYVSLTVNGKYTFPDNDYYIKDHIKVSMGALFRSKFFFEETFFSGGVSYNYYGEYYGEFHDKVLQPMSCELGVLTRIKRVCVAFRFDVLKIESSLDLGFTF